MPLPKRICFAAAGALSAFLMMGICHAGFVPIPLAPASYNQQMIVPANAPAPFVEGGYTTATMDSGTNNTGTTWYEEGYNVTNPLTGLPHPGTTFTSSSLPNHEYTMPPSYTADNALMLDSALTSGTFTVLSPAAYSGLSFLESGGHNGVSFSYAVYHQDGAVETGATNIPDWYNGSNPAWTANGRVDVDSYEFSSVDGNDPRLYSLDIPLTDTGSPVTRISFAYVSGSGHGAIMAVSGLTGSVYYPMGVSGYNEDIVVEQSAGKESPLTGQTTATMDTGTNNVGSTFYEAGYVPQAPDTGLPPPGSLVTNSSASDHIYEMAPSYAANDTALLYTNCPSILLVPQTQTNFAALSFLAACGNGPATLGCTVYHADGGTESNSFTVPDWFYYSPVALEANGRVYVDDSTVDSINSGSPRLYSEDMPLRIGNSAITGIRLNFVSGNPGANAAVFAVSGGADVLPLTGDDFNANTEAAAQTLQQWYNDSGLYNSTGWWNAANGIEALIEDIIANNDSQFLPVLTNTFNLNSSGDFIDSYYDDNGWWANVWIHAYDITGNTNFLNMAKIIFAFNTNGWDTTNVICPEGMWWNTSHTYKNAIPNELFLMTAIRLHQRTPGDGGPLSYFYWATNEWTWFKNSGMINSQNLINDGLTSDCANNGETTWTYNQGVILGGLTDLYKVTGDTNYLDEAMAIANATIANLVDDNRILLEPCDDNCGGDGTEFKGIFERNLAYLYDETHYVTYYNFLYNNANAVWSKDRNVFNQLGQLWDGPYDTDDASRQSSALMAVVAPAEPITSALAFCKGSGDPAFGHSIGAAAGTLAWSTRNVTQTGFLQSGPGISYLSTGPHAAHFQLGVSALNASVSNLVELEVEEDNGGTVLASCEVPWSAFVTTNSTQDFLLLFTNALAADPLEFRVYWNNVAGAPVLTVSDVSIDGLMNWSAANLSHSVGRLDGLNGWEADPVRDTGSGYLCAGPGVGGLAPGDYTAQFELKVDNFNWDNSAVAQISVVDVDDNLIVASQTLTRDEFPTVLYQEFPLNFEAEAGKHYDFRTYWYYRSAAPRLTERAVMLKPGPTPFFTSAQWNSGTMLLNFIGTPGQTYTIQTSPSLTNPHWSDLGSGTVPAYLGSAQFSETIQTTNEFYRLAYP